MCCHYSMIELAPLRQLMISNFKRIIFDPISSWWKNKAARRVYVHLGSIILIMRGTMYNECMSFIVYVELAAIVQG